MALAPNAVISPRRPENRRRNHNTNKKTIADPLKVHVSGFPPYTKEVDLKNTFEPYGNVSVQLLKNFAIVTLPTAEKAKEAIADSNKLIVYGEFITVKPFIGQGQEKKAIKRVFIRSKEKNVIIEPSKIDLSGDFLQQLDQLLSAVRLTQAEVKCISQLYIDLEDALSRVWPGCRAIPFGSITTGLGIQTSDADCFVDIPPQYKSPNVNYVNKAKKMLQTFPKIFTEILSIQTAQTPIVKFFHIPTETNCDVSFKTPLGKKNSELIALLLNSDPRLIPVAVAIKYWAKVHGISGGGKLSNYALTMLLIFFLQQPHISILPPIEALQRDRTFDCIVDGWNTGVDTRGPALPKPDSKCSIAELMAGFFEFYSTFNFEEETVCPFLGRTIKKSCFEDLDSLPEEMERYKRNVIDKIASPIKHARAIVIQDPIEMRHNVSSGMSLRLQLEFKEYLKFAAAAYAEDLANGSSNFLRKILLEKPPLPEKKARTEYEVKVQARELHQVAETEWKSVIRNVLTVMFKDICLAELEAGEKAQESTEQYTIAVTRAIWKRKRFTKLYSHMDGSFLQKQIGISNEIIRVNKEKHNLQMRLIITYADETRNAKARLKFVDGDKSAFTEFGFFFLQMIKWFYILMRPFLKDVPSANDSKDSIQAEVEDAEERIGQSESDGKDSDEDCDAECGAEHE